MALSPVRLCASMSVGSADTIAFTRSNSPALIASMKAALLEPDSMLRFYRGRVAASGFLVWLAVGALAHAQNIPQVQERPALGASMTADAIGTLPSSSNLYSLLDTVVP